MGAARDLEIINIMRNDAEKAEYFLLFFDDELKKYEEIVQDIADETPRPCGNNGGTTYKVSNPTLDKILNIEKEYPDYVWLEAVKLFQRMQGEKKLIFLRVRREAANIPQKGRGRKGWVVYTQRRYAEELAKRFVMAEENAWHSETTIKKWWQEMINQMVSIVAAIEKSKR